MNVPLNIDWHQILLHLFNFAILAFGLYFILYKPVKQFMDKRSEYYEIMDKEAKERLERAKNSENEYSEKLNMIDDEIEKKRQKAQKMVLNETEKVMISAKKEAEKIVSDAYIKAENERNKLLENAQKEISEMVTSATEKLVLKSSTAESYEQFLEAVERSAGDGE